MAGQAGSMINRREGSQGTRLAGPATLKLSHSHRILKAAAAAEALPSHNADVRGKNRKLIQI